ncbi:MAG: DUF4340 domain-containing protein [Polyangiaceae bacterium]|nr:DUF4340 domain-containing protein [Polyangiaceae bacterium]
MKIGRGFFVHVALLGLAILAAVLVWTRDKQPKTLAQGDVTVWTGRAEDIERISFEGKSKKVSLEAKKDGAGTYFVGTAEKEIARPKKDPHGHEAPDAADAGADAGGEAEPPAPKERTTVAFVSVSAAQKLVDQLAPLKALRSIGKIGDDRAAEFGLVESEGTLTVKMGGSERKLVFGGPTPGGGDRYARDPASGEVYAIKGDIFRNLDGAESSLMERSLHEWPENDVAAATIAAQGKTRNLVRGGEERKRFWADPTTPDANDETAGNWMSKLDRLRPSEYSLTPPAGAEVVVRIDFTGANAAKLGYLELIKAPPAASDAKPDYFIVTERTRLHAKVPTQAAEQVEQDVGSVLK